jgi:hypothetical protein
MLLPESFTDVENAEGRGVSDKNRGSVFTSGALFGKVSLDLVLGIGDESRTLGRSFLTDEYEVLVSVWCPVEVGGKFRIELRTG